METKVKAYPAWVPSGEESEMKNKVLKDFISARNVIQKSYNQFNGQSLYDVIDDWSMRWNGYISQSDILEDNPQSSIFLNFTRNAIISYLAKVALDTPKANITVANRKTSLNNKRLAEICKDLIKYSENQENYPARFLELALETIVKGTGVVYEGYAKDIQKMKVPESFDALTGKLKYKEEKRTVFDGCFQKIVPIEDFYIANPYQPDVQKQPFIIWREVTTYDESVSDYGHYKNFDSVKPGAYVLLSEPTTFYRNKLYTELAPNQVEILRYYNRKNNEHAVTINGIVIYNGPIPFKDGKYPFAKAIHEPFGNDFFWGMSFANKVMGEQDLANTFFNMMVDKTAGSLLPYGLSSDLDDLIEDDVLAPNKIRKVSDINKWKFDTLPAVNSAEQAMLQTTIGFLRENSGDLTGAGQASTPRGGKLAVRQVLLRQQEAMQKLGFSMNFLEDFAKDRTELRLSHILQFYTIPKIEKITGKNGKEMEQLLYRDIKLSNISLEGEKTGNRIIKFVDTPKTEDERMKLADELSVTEAMGEEAGMPTEALAVAVDTFKDYNFDIQIVKNSSYEKNRILDQASRQEYANWRLSMQQFNVPVDAQELVNWVDESYDVDSERFKPKQSQGAPGQPAQPQQGAEQPPQGMQPAKTMAPKNLPAMSGVM